MPKSTQASEQGPRNVEEFLKFALAIAMHVSEWGQQIMALCEQIRNTGARKHAFAIQQIVLALAVAVPLFAIRGTSWGQTAARGATSTVARDVHAQSRAPVLLQQFDTSLVTLTSKVTPAVVQVMVTGYGPVHRGNQKGDVGLFARQRDLGSGVILDPEGYIITNNHVVEGAQRIRVVLPSPASGPFDVRGATEPRILEAKLVGADKDTDLALLKVNAHDLPTLTLAAERAVSPGEVVLAVGSPEGLQSTVTMGVVSSVWRQPDPDNPAVYIQTDAPINQGNSGGPLVDIDGYVIGLNTMILSESGGSEGLGFAIPARTVRYVSENLRKYGHVYHTEIQASAQEITPSLAEGLGLQDWGVIISDVTPEGPAAAAGLKVGDIVYSVDGRRIVRLPDFTAALYMHSPNELVRLCVLRGPQKLSLAVPAIPRHDEIDDLADLIDPHDLIGRLGVFVRDFGDARSALPNARIDAGVVVVAQSPELNSYTSSLRSGDIIHSLNRTPVESVQQLRSMLRGITSGQAVVFQIERDRTLQYIAFEWGD